MGLIYRGEHDRSDWAGHNGEFELQPPFLPLLHLICTCSLALGTCIVVLWVQFFQIEITI